MNDPNTLRAFIGNCQHKLALHFKVVLVAEVVVVVVVVLNPALQHNRHHH
jgi:hypothetical protein